MTAHIIRRILSVAFTFIVVSIIIFLMMHSVPGGPFDANDMPVSEAVRAKMMAQWGLDQPLHVQYFNYMWGVLHLDFGVPFQSPGETVVELISRAWVPSLVLGGTGVLIGAPSASFSAWPPPSIAIPGSTTWLRPLPRWGSPSRCLSPQCC